MNTLKKARLCNLDCRCVYGTQIPEPLALIGRLQVAYNKVDARFVVAASAPHPILKITGR